jgi:hypothetical protein
MTPRHSSICRRDTLRAGAGTATTLFVLALAFVGAGAEAGSVYKCRDAHGTTLYSDRPCEPQSQKALPDTEHLRESVSSGDVPGRTSPSRAHADRIEQGTLATAGAKHEARRARDSEVHRTIGDSRLREPADSDGRPAITTQAASKVPGGASLAMGIQPAYLPAGVTRCEYNSYSDVWCP